MSNEFALELTKSIEELSLDKGINRETLIKQAVKILERKDIDILQSIKETEETLESARSRFNNAVDEADIEESIVDITAAETKLSALRSIAKESCIKADTIQYAGYAERGK